MALNDQLQGKSKSGGRPATCDAIPVKYYGIRLNIHVGKPFRKAINFIPMNCRLIALQQARFRQQPTSSVQTS